MSKYVPRAELSPEELEKARRKNKYYVHMNQLGHRFRCEGAQLEQVTLHVHTLCASGMSVGDIHAASGIAEMTVRAIRDRKRDWVANRVGKALLMVRPELTGGNMRVPFTGTQRRVQALFTDGYTFTYMGQPVGWKANALWRLAHGYGMAGGSKGTQLYVYRRTAETVRQVYDKLAGAQPLDHGVPAKQVTYARKRGRALGWAPSHCWDSDTIDNPDCFPEWTGRCGTTAGYSMHYKHKILPACKACYRAKADAQTAKRERARERERGQ